MPYQIKKVRNRNCYSVYNTKTKKKFSKCTSLYNAKKQFRLLRALQYNPLFVPYSRKNKSVVNNKPMVNNKTRKNK
jgi:hypothetical protein